MRIVASHPHSTLSQLDVHRRACAHHHHCTLSSSAADLLRAATPTQHPQLDLHRCGSSYPTHTAPSASSTCRRIYTYTLRGGVRVCASVSHTYAPRHTQTHTDIQTRIHAHVHAYIYTHMTCRDTCVCARTHAFAHADTYRPYRNAPFRTATRWRRLVPWYVALNHTDYARFVLASEFGICECC